MQREMLTATCLWMVTVFPLAEQMHRQIPSTRGNSLLLPGDDSKMAHKKLLLIWKKKIKKKRKRMSFKREMSWLGKSMWAKVEKTYVLQVSAETAAATASALLSSLQFSS